MKQTARIDDWSVFGDSLIGHVSSHPNQNNFNNLYQRTSQIIHLDRERKIAETLNTIYTLGDENVNVQYD